VEVRRRRKMKRGGGGLTGLGRRRCCKRVGACCRSGRVGS
jgi:hypothetical protein